jgi:hypothetical protein
MIFVFRISQSLKVGFGQCKAKKKRHAGKACRALKDIPKNYFTLLCVS